MVGLWEWRNYDLLGDVKPAMVQPFPLAEQLCCTLMCLRQVSAELLPVTCRKLSGCIRIVFLDVLPVERNRK